MKKSVAVFVCVLALAACNRQEESGASVATPTVTLNRAKAAQGSPLQITYKFAVSPNARIDADYNVFVHVMTPDGEKMWQDDHLPSVPTSQWKPGQTVEYTRTIFVPNYPYVGEATIRLGLYNTATGKRLVLNGEEATRHEYVVGSLGMLPESENLFLLYKDGWHPPEVDSNNPLSQWQWTKKVAAIAFRNPKRDATFYLDLDARTDLFNPPQQVTVKVAGEPLTTFSADQKHRHLRTFEIKAAQFGTADMTEIVLEVDRTFSGTGDSRELGIRVFHTFVEPK
jgi:hypothetical protein